MRYGHGLPIGVIALALACGGRISLDASGKQASGDAGQNGTSGGGSMDNAETGLSSSGADASSGGSSGGSGDADTASAWTPNALRSRLAFWFDPNSLAQVGGKVTKWNDLSGNGNDAVQGSSEYEPTYSANGIGGLASAMFTGPITFLSIADSATMQWSTSDFVVLAVARASAQTAQNAMLYQKTGPYPYDGVNLYLNANKPIATSLAAAQVSGDVYVVSSPPPSTFVDSSVHLFGAFRTGATLEIRVDGAISSSTTNASVASVDVNAVGLAAIIGQNGYGTPSAEFQQLHGDVAEMLGVRGRLTETDITSLERYLKSRYAIP